MIEDVQKQSTRHLSPDLPYVKHLKYMGFKSLEEHSIRFDLCELFYVLNTHDFISNICFVFNQSLRTCLNFKKVYCRNNYQKFIVQ